MSDTLKLLRKALDRARDKERTWSAKAEAIMQEISAICDHARTREFKWEHDNGYGQQTTMHGLVCLDCSAHNYWPSTGGNWSWPYE